MLQHAQSSVVYGSMNGRKNLKVHLKSCFANVIFLKNKFPPKPLQGDDYCCTFHYWT